MKRWNTILLMSALLLSLLGGAFTPGVAQAAPAAQPLQVSNITVTSIVRAGGAAADTTAATADFTVTFSAAVSGVGASDFAATAVGLSGASVTTVTPDTSSSGSSATYTVTINTGSGKGSVRLDVPSTASITGGAAVTVPYTSGASYNVTRMPSNGYIDVSALGVHTCGVTSAGAVKCWGLNDMGQLGNNTRIDSNVPVQVSGLTSGYVSVSTEYNYTCALSAAGGVKCWGANGTGVLGNNTTTDSYTPVDVLSAVSTPLSGVTQLVTGSANCALITGGTVKCWGSNFYGEVGIGTTSPNKKLMATDVTGLTGVVSIYGMDPYTCAKLDSGAVKCWGRNGYGQLGTNDIIDKTSATTAVNLPGPYLSMATGQAHTCVLTNIGDVKCLGHNFYGQLGNAANTDNAGYELALVTTTDGTNPLSGQVYISAGQALSCSVSAAGKVNCWGMNQSGELGDGTTVDKNVATVVSNISSGVIRVSAGFSHACALFNTGVIKCWGANTNGALGDGTNTDSSVPVTVFDPPLVESITRVGGSSTVTGTTASYTVTFNRAVSGVDTTDFQLGGLGLSGVSITSVTPSSGPASSYTVLVSTGNGVGPLTLALIDNNSITDASSTPLADDKDGSYKSGEAFTVNRPVSGLPATQVVSGNSHSCLLKDGGVKCWGYNSMGQLGDAGSADSHVPVSVSGLSSGVTALVAGQNHTCALLSGGGVKCWGYNRNGQLGDDTKTDSNIPVSVKGTGGTGALAGVSAISAGADFSCAVISGAVKCWGDNTSGQLGTGDNTASNTPVSVVGLGGTGTLADITQISSGDQFTCALNTSGAVQCWGFGDNGQLGDTGYSLTPYPVPVTSTEVFGSVQAGGLHVCALSVAGGVYCWGLNADGQVGTDPNVDYAVGSPMAVSGLSKLVSSINLGANHSCAILNDDTLKCWGNDLDGQLGDGNTTSLFTPVAVTALASSSKLTSLALGEKHTCLITATDILCWGYNASGQLGNGSTNDSLTPVSVTLTFPPSAFTLTTPLEGATVSTGPTLQWGSSTGATSYEYCYDTTNDSACSSWTSNSTSTSKALSGLSNGTYYWLVRANNADGTTYAGGSATTFRSFVYNSPTPGGFSLTSPISGAHVSASPTLKWGTATGANSYEYCYDKTNDNACSPWVTNGTATSKSLSGLSAGTYYWLVRAKNANGNTYAGGSSTSYQTFVVDTTKPTVVSIKRVDPNPSLASTVHYLVTFSENVTGVNLPDFKLTAVGVANAQVTAVQANTAAPSTLLATDTYRVTVTTGTKAGTLRLDVVNDGSIRDTVGNVLAAAFSSGQKYTFDRNSWLTSTPNRDGWALESTETSNTGGSVNPDGSTYLMVGDDQLDRQYRSIVSFSTNILPDNAVIVSVTLKIKLFDTLGTDPLSSFGGLVADIKKGSFGPSMYLDMQDFESPASASSVGVLLPDATKPGWYSMELPAGKFNLINRTGFTDFRLRFKIDDNNNNTRDVARFLSGETPLGGQRPSLYIRYIIP